MDIMTQAKFHFNRLMLTLIFGVWASEPPPGPGERLKKPGLIELKETSFRLRYAPRIHPVFSADEDLTTVA